MLDVPGLPKDSEARRKKPLRISGSRELGRIQRKKKQLV